MDLKNIIDKYSLPAVAFGAPIYETSSNLQEITATINSIVLPKHCMFGLSALACSAALTYLTYSINK